MDRTTRILVFVMTAAAVAVFMAALWAALAGAWAAGGFAAALTAIGALHAFFLAERGRANDKRVDEIAGLSDRVRKDIESMEERMSRFEVRPQFEPGTPQSDLLSEVRSLRSSLQSFARDTQSPKPASPKSQFDQDRLELLLEPVVALKSGETIHYRASLSLAAADGHRVNGLELLREADRNGLRTHLDVFSATKVIPAIERIRARRPEARIFALIGAQTLASAAHVGTIVDALRAAPLAASGIVLEVDHAVLAGLGQTGAEGLARLAQVGASFALVRANPSGIELASLRDLRFRFLVFEAMTIPQASHVPPVWSGLARFARNQGFHIVIANAASEAEVLRAGAWADYGCGPAFAPPRLVRADLDAEAAAQDRAAA